MWYLLPEHRNEFSKPFGTLYKDFNKVLDKLQGKILCSVGDIVTKNLITEGIIPDIAIIDGFTRRAPVTDKFVIGSRLINVKNPAGTLTQELLDAILDGINSPPVLISVDGEEDLAVIPLVIKSKEGTIILYGQPGEGVVLRVVDEGAKIRARQLFDLFESSK